MAKDEQVILSPEEAQLVDEALTDFLDQLTGSLSEVDQERRRGLRILAKLSRVVHRSSLSWSMPDWLLPILQQTFAPQAAAVPAKKPAPKAPARSSHKTAGPSPEAKRAAPKGLGKSGGVVSAARRSKPTKVAPTAGIAAGALGSTSAPTPSTVPLTASAARRRGGLLRAAQYAEAKGDTAAARQYRKRAEQLEVSTAAADAHS